MESPIASNLEFTVNDLAPLRAEVEAALAGHRDVGQINPRRPGVHNRAIQSVKKVMRRSLTWYTRPIHVFQGAVIRALQQVVSLLQGQQKVSSKFAQELSRVADQVARANQTAVDTREQFVRQTAGTKADVLEQASRANVELSGRIDTTKADVLEQASRANVELSGRIDTIKADVLEQVSRANVELSGRIDTIKADVLEQVAGANGELSSRIDNIRDSIRKQLEQFSTMVDILRSEFNSERNELLTVIRQQRMRERDIRRFVHAVEEGVTSLASRPAQPTPPMFASELKHHNEFDYFAFEDRFRGNEALIRTRQAEYLKHFFGRENVIDVGCGRGEFLELLRDNGIAARGVEIGLDQFLLCREKGLDVAHQDLFSFLESLPDDSIGGLFSAQVIEHLTASDQLRYVALAYRKSKPGSPVIFETINAQCVFAIVQNFFLDPTHVRPVHPETLKFAMESVNFQNVQLRFSSPVVDRQIPALDIGGRVEEVEKFNVAIRQLNDLIYGYQDYAAIGWHL